MSGVTVTDELEGVVGWIEHDRMQRTSHALAADGRVWLVDPVDGPDVEDRVRALGEPAGVIQLLDRHKRDSAVLAARLGVRHHVVPRSLPDSPFTFLPVLSTRIWDEVALWWPERKILVCADALGTIPFFRAGDEPVGPHPLLRLVPPGALRGLGAEHVLVGHGGGRHGPATAQEVDRSLGSARRNVPRWLFGLRRAFGAQR